MDRIFVSDRVETRHPEQRVTKRDAADAWRRAIRSRPRLGKNPNEYIAIGVDGKGRLVELVAVRDADGDFLIYHAFTPPTRKFKRELGMEGR